MPLATQQVRVRLDTTVRYQSGATIPEKLSRGTILRRLAIRLKGTLTVTDANNTTAKTKIGDEWASIAMIELIVNDGTVLRRFTGNELWWLNYFIEGKPPAITPAIGGGAANPAFDSVLYIPFMGFNGMLDNWNPTDYCLDTSQLSNIELRITWASYTAVNADATGWTVEPSLEVYRLDSYFPPNIRNPFYATSYCLEMVNNNSTGATPGLQQQLPVGGFQYLGFLINTTNAAGTTESSGIIDNIRIRSGGQYYLNNFPATVARQNAAMWKHLQQGIPSPTGATAAYLPMRRSAASVNDAWIFYNLITDQYSTEGIDTLGLSELLMEFDTLAAGSIRILPLRITPIRA